MPPEGLRSPPVYTAKLDCFSFGVLGIQIITRRFPNPGPEEQIIEDARSPTGTMKVPILDSERRKSHIDLIAPNHPLLPLILHCLCYRDGDRPSAQELCDQLETLKGGVQYRHSQIQGQDQVAVQVRQAKELHQQQLRDEDAVVAAGQEREQQLRQELGELKKQLQQELREKNQQVADKTRYQLETQQLILEKDQAIEAKDRAIEAKDYLIATKERQLQELNHQLQDNEAAVADFQQVLIEREKEIEQLREDISAMTRERAVERVPKQHQVASATPVDTIKVKWKTCLKAPDGMRRGSSAVSSDGSKVYFAWLNNVYEYSSKENQWSNLPQCPREHSSLAVVERLLTAVGGIMSDCTLTNDLFSLTCETTEQPWAKHYPPMPTKRWYPAVVCSGNSLVVAGGYGDDTTVAVEVMDISGQQWFTASSLPHYFNNASATLCGDSLYLMGGFKEHDTGNGSLSVLTCSLTALLNSCHSQSLLARMKALFTTERSQVWKKASDAPVYLTSCSTICGRVIAVGGNRKASWLDSDPTDNVYQYDPIKNTWTVISHMPTSQYQCLIAALPDNSILVVGGCDQRVYSNDITEVGLVVNE